MKDVQLEPDPPEDTQAETALPSAQPSLSPWLRAELEAWDRASAQALDLVERLAREMEVEGAAGVKALEGRQERK